MRIPAWLGVLGLLALGCTDDDAKDGDDGEPAGDADTDTDTDTDAETTRDTGGGFDTGAGDPADHFAFLSLGQSAGATYVIAAFYDVGSGGETTPATGTIDVTIGDCTASTFPAGGTATGGTTGSIGYMDPGEVEVTIAGAEVALDDLGGVYSGDLAVWPGGQVLGFSISGAEFPAFSFTDLLVVPEQIVVPTQPTAIDASQDLQLAWEAGDGDVYVYVSGGDTSVFCSFDDPSGTGLVPAEALALIPPGYVNVRLSRDASVVEFLPEGELVFALVASSESWTANLR
jgi:hypothetical protein